MCATQVLCGFSVEVGEGVHVWIDVMGCTFEHLLKRLGVTYIDGANERTKPHRCEVMSLGAVVAADLQKASLAGWKLQTWSKKRAGEEVS